MEYTDNQEWLLVKTDSEDKILYGVRIDGSFDCNGIPHDVKSSINSIQNQIDNLGTEYFTNEEWIRFYTDNDGKILWGIKSNGEIYPTDSIFNKNIESLRSALQEEIDSLENRTPDLELVS